MWLGIAQECFFQKPGANVIEFEPIPEDSEEHNDPWLRTVSNSSEIEVDENDRSNLQGRDNCGQCQD